MKLQESWLGNLTVLEFHMERRRNIARLSKEIREMIPYVDRLRLNDQSLYAQAKRVLAKKETELWEWKTGKKFQRVVSYNQERRVS